MWTKRVLVIGCNRSEYINIDYLLQLSGCQVTVVASASEAIAWMLNGKTRLGKLDLIAIYGFPALMEFVDHFAGLITLKRKVPILVIDRFMTSDKFKSVFRRLFDDFDINFCGPEELVPSMDGLLGGNLVGHLNSTSSLS